MNLGLPELLVVFAIGLLVFGPKRLPELAKNLGKGIRDFKKALNGDADEQGQMTQASDPQKLSQGGSAVTAEPTAPAAPATVKPPDSGKA